jgi:hypothetical protein
MNLSDVLMLLDREAHAVSTYLHAHFVAASLGKVTNADVC